MKQDINGPLTMTHTLTHCVHTLNLGKEALITNIYSLAIVIEEIKRASL